MSAAPDRSQTSSHRSAQHEARLGAPAEQPLSTYADAVPVPQAAATDCGGGGESFALRVLGSSMEPEFNEGEIIIIEPDGLARDGAFVLAWQVAGPVRQRGNAVWASCFFLARRELSPKSPTAASKVG